MLLNFPDTDHLQGNIHAADVARLPAGSLFWASPECPKWSAARGRRRDFDKEPDLFGETLPDPAADRSRALMWDVPRYLEAVAGRGRPVLAGVVENVIEVRQWACWPDWVWSIRRLGYRTRLIALNSMRALPRLTLAGTQTGIAGCGRTPGVPCATRRREWCRRGSGSVPTWAVPPAVRVPVPARPIPSRRPQACRAPGRRRD